MKDGRAQASVGFQRVRPDGLASFSLLADRTYRVGAFTDENGNRAYDAGEPLAILKEVKPLLLDDPNVQPKIWELRLRRDYGLARGTVITIPKDSDALGGKLNVAFGEVASLDDKRFAEKAGSGGL